MIPLNIPIFSTILLVQLTLAGQDLVEYHPGHPGAVDHGGMVIVLDDVVEVLMNKDFHDIIEYNDHPAIVYGARVSRMILDQVLACEGKLWLD